MQVRIAAAHAICAVLYQGESLSRTLPQWSAKLDRSDEHALLQEMCFGVLRWYPRLSALLAQLIRKPLKGRDQDLECLLLLGIYQLMYMRIQPHAAVKETVDAVLGLNKAWAKGFVNGVLRRFQREQSVLESAVARSQSARYAHPDWWIERLKIAWPEEWQAILEANNARPPMALRVNLARITREEYLAKLNRKGIDAEVSRYVDSGVILKQALNVDALPGFSEGLVSVQDCAAQLAASLLDLSAGQRVLDVCAAPGGKTAHILEHESGLSAVCAVDIDADRLRRVEQNLTRLDLRATAVQGDANTPHAWWDGEQFDRILLDAPCSASGVIRRHPDIKHLRQSNDIEALTQLQARILESVWPLLRSGGMLLYATCSILPQENSDQIDRFLKDHSDAQERVISADWGRAVNHGRQILPGDREMDGFYYACVEKQ